MVRGFALGACVQNPLYPQTSMDYFAPHLTRLSGLFLTLNYIVNVVVRSPLRLGAHDIYLSLIHS